MLRIIITALYIKISKVVEIEAFLYVSHVLSDPVKITFVLKSFAQMSNNWWNIVEISFFLYTRHKIHSKMFGRICNWWKLHRRTLGYYSEHNIETMHKILGHKKEKKNQLQIMTKRGNMREMNYESSWNKRCSMLNEHVQTATEIKEKKVTGNARKDTRGRGGRTGLWWNECCLSHSNVGQRRKAAQVKDKQGKYW